MKNIIKRIIVGVGIALILGFINSCEVRALTYQSQILGIDTTLDYVGEFKNVTVNNNFKNFGKGKVIFSIQYSPGSGSINANRTIDEIRLNGSDGSGWICEIGDISTYWESVQYVQVISPVCYIDTSNNRSITSVSFRAKRIGSQTIQIRSSDIWTFIEDSTYNDSNVISAIQSMMSQNLIIHNENRVDSQSIINAINSMKTSQETLQQQQIQQQQQTNQKIDETNDFLKDNSIPNNSDYNFSDYNEENGVITNLLTMPITLIQVVMNGLNSSCSNYQLGNLLGTNLEFRCLNLGQHLGIVWNIIDVILSGVFIFIFGKKCIRIFNDVTNLRSNQVNEVFK